MVKVVKDDNDNGVCNRAARVTQYLVVSRVAQQLRAIGFDCQIVEKPNGHVQCVARRLKDRR
jgi:hypothetical protein